VKLAGIVVDKSSHMATIHLTKGAPKSTRLDAVAVRKRASTKGDVVVEVKPGEEVTSVNVNWTVEKFVAAVNGKANGHKGTGDGKKNGSVKASAAKKTKASPTKKATPAKKAKAPIKKAAPKKPGTKTKTAKKKK
jgi:hypothetical protein